MSVNWKLDLLKLQLELKTANLISWLGDRRAKRFLCLETVKALRTLAASWFLNTFGFLEN
jgi:hypothetical protein